MLTLTRPELLEAVAEVVLVSEQAGDAVKDVPPADRDSTLSSRGSSAVRLRELELEEKRLEREREERQAERAREDRKIELELKKLEVAAEERRMAVEAEVIRARSELVKMRLELIVTSGCEKPRVRITGEC